MKISIARDGSVIGEYDEDEIAPLARSQFLQPTDLYWREGLPDWQLLTVLVGADVWQADTPPIPDATAPVPVPLSLPDPEPAPAPPSEPAPTVEPTPAPTPGAEPASQPAPPSEPTPAPTPRAEVVPADPAPRTGRARLRLALIVVGVVAVVVGGTLFYFRRGQPPVPPGSTATTTPTTATPAPPAGNDPAAQLKAKLAGLRHPPADFVYEDVTDEVQKFDSPFSTYAATISGRELILDHDTRKTAFVLEFTVIAGYQDGDWFFDHATGTFYGTADYKRFPVTEDFREPRFCRNLISALQLRLGPH